MLPPRLFIQLGRLVTSVQKALTTADDGDDIAEIMKNHLSLGNSLGLLVTPSFVIDGVALLGYPGPKPLRAIVDAVGTCGKVMC